MYRTIWPQNLFSTFQDGFNEPWDHGLLATIIGEQIRMLEIDMVCPNLLKCLAHSWFFFSCHLRMQSILRN